MIPLDNVLKQFWELKNVPNKSCSAPDDIIAEEICKTTIKRDESGRFIVALPFRNLNSLPDFPNSRCLALNRLYSLERRLLKNPQLYSAYLNFMQEYLNQNHMEPVSKYINDFCFYIPHYCVIKPDSLTTKLRVVFNASAKSTG